jgi:hypothetical protein
VLSTWLPMWIATLMWALNPERKTPTNLLGGLAARVTVTSADSTFWQVTRLPGCGRGCAQAIEANKASKPCLFIPMLFAPLNGDTLTAAETQEFYGSRHCFAPRHARARRAHTNWSFDASISSATTSQGLPRRMSMLPASPSSIPVATRSRSPRLLNGWALPTTRNTCARSGLAMNPVNKLPIAQKLMVHRPAAIQRVYLLLNGRPIDAAWAASREPNERLTEINQIKGSRKRILYFHRGMSLHISKS